MTLKREISANPPRIREHHVRLPLQLADLLGASRLHEKKITGRGTRVAVIDSGFFAHPFYQTRGYSIEYVRTAREKHPEIDEYGHGTAQLASLLSVAPETHVLAVKCLDRDPANAIEAAIAQKPDVISCAWGFNIDHPGRREVPSQYRRTMRLIMKAVDEGICVVAAAGNGQHAFPGCMPQVIAAGGVYYGPNGELEPSDISSTFESSIFPGRKVPDLCGVVGNSPHGRLLLVPVPPNARLARRPSFSMSSAGDGGELEEKDARAGWAMFSGTSAATAMISGGCALIRQAVPGLKPSLVRQILVEGSRSVRLEAGTSDPCRLMDMESAMRALDNLV